MRGSLRGGESLNCPKWLEPGSLALIPGKPGVFCAGWLLPLIACRVWQFLLVLKHGTEIEHVEIPAAGFAFPKPTGLCDRLASSLLASDLAASDWRCEAGDFGHGIILNCLPWRFRITPIGADT